MSRNPYLKTLICECAKNVQDVLLRPDLAQRRIEFEAKGEELRENRERD
jgi:hypothetical protein